MKEHWKVFHQDREVVPSLSKGGASTAKYDGKYWWVHANGYAFRLQKTSVSTHISAEAEHTTENVVRAPMTGTITEIMVKNGDLVNKGDPLFKMEAMKMQYTLFAPTNGKAAQIQCKKGDVVEADSDLIVIL